MNKFVYFMAVGLAFAVLQVATVEADHDATHTGGEVPMCGDVPCPPPEGEAPMCGDVPCPPPEGGVPMCGDVPCPPPTDGDVTGEVCADKETPALVAACDARQTGAGS